jgi:cytochrome oxidase Cu insertion factor (SCO1/SenC/PrrC family)
MPYHRNRNRQGFGLRLACVALSWSLAAIGSADATQAAPAESRQLAVGDRAPDFSLQGSDGKTYRLSELQGKQVVVLAWFAKAFSGG